MKSEQSDNLYSLAEICSATFKRVTDILCENRAVADPEKFLAAAMAVQELGLGEKPESTIWVITQLLGQSDAIRNSNLLKEIVTEG
jgi:hypothetical protein